MQKGTVNVRTTTVQLTVVQIAVVFHSLLGFLFLGKLRQVFYNSLSSGIVSYTSIVSIQGTASTMANERSDLNTGMRCVKYMIFVINFMFLVSSDSAMNESEPQ